MYRRKHSNKTAREAAQIMKEILWKGRKGKKDPITRVDPNGRYEIWVWVPDK